MSNIDPSKPEQGQATTLSVRDNFAAADVEIDSNVAALAVLEPGGADAFAAYLAGFLNTGFHSEFTGDLDTLLINSEYVIQETGVTNGPADFATGGFIKTMLSTGDFGAVQILVGGNSIDKDKIWTRAREASAWGAWVLVVDGGATTLRYAGVQDDGFSEVFAGNIDAIIINSRYSIFTGVGGTLPGDFVAANVGIIETYMTSSSGNLVQLLLGVQSANLNKQWQRSKVSDAFSAWVRIVNGAV